ncbi:MAG: enoyl-CoA hydratase/isomerase family protein [Thermoleophilaceae bacterium]|nr:enoyl-CoA hydratase/isomerase family protein [Thermoleophilaceae bacterium]
MSDVVLYAVEDGVATITLNLPERRNALSASSLAQLRTTLARMRDDDSVRAGVLTGAGKAFCAGGDLREFAAQSQLPARYYGTREMALVLRELSELGKPLIAAVNGAAVGVGLGLALSCDLIVADETAVFCAPEVEIGLFPFMIAPIITRSVPRFVANGLLLLGDRIVGSRAAELGLVNRAVPSEEVLPLARQWASMLAAQPAAMMRIGRDARSHADGMPLSVELDFMHSHIPVATVNPQTNDSVGEALRRSFKGKDD